MITPVSIFEGAREIAGEALEDAVGTNGGSERNSSLIPPEAGVALSGIKSTIDSIGDTQERLRRTVGGVVDIAFNQAAIATEALRNTRRN